MESDGNGEPRRLTFSPADDIEPDWSPDGRGIVFASSRGGDFDIWVMRADGGDIRPLISTRGRDTQPVWIPGRP